MATRRKSKKAAGRKGAAKRKPARKASRRKASPRKPGSRRKLRSFGGIVRNLREEASVGLRELSEIVGMSPAYLSMVEREELAPPAEDKVVAIAQALSQDPDEFLALAGRVASDLPAIIMKHPKGMAELVRATRGLSLQKIQVLTKQARRSRR